MSTLGTRQQLLGPYFRPVLYFCCKLIIKIIGSSFIDNKLLLSNVQRQSTACGDGLKGEDEIKGNMPG